MKYWLILSCVAALSSGFTLQIPARHHGTKLLRMAERSQTLEKMEESIQSVNETTLADNVAMEDVANKSGETEVKEELSETQKLMQQVKDAGIAGVISYAAWEFGFWTISVPICIAGYKGVTGHWPDFSNQEDLQKLGAEAFAFVNFARFAVPLRIGLALGTTPWIRENIVERFLEKNKSTDQEMSTEADRGLE